MINVLIIDDHQILRAGLKLIFETVDDITVVDTAADGEEGLRKAIDLRPDLVMTDIRMPKLDGIALIKVLHEKIPDLPVIVLTTFDDQKPIQEAMQLGVRGFLLKDADKITILRVIHGAMNGETYIEPRIAAKAFAASKSFQPTIELSEKEHTILTAVAQGYHSKEIAEDLKVSERTIKSHLTSIYNKLGVFTRAEAVAKALLLGLIQL